MKKNLATLLIAGGLAVVASSAFGEDNKAASDSYKAAPADRPGANMPADSPAMRDDGSGANLPADNSGKNVRDRSDTALTPGDQSSRPEDVAITQQLRKAVVDDPNLSINAQNVKIITIDGVVTLRGPVKNASEKENIAAKARKIVGVTRVDNQIELAGE